MRLLLLLPLLLLAVSPQQEPATNNDPYVTVLGFKYAKARQVPPAVEPVLNQPARAMIPQNKNYQRNARINDPMGARDPNLDTIDGRSEALEKAVQTSRTPQPKAVEGYEYRAKVKNTSSNPVEIVFWEYQFINSAKPDEMVRHQFLCGVKVPANKEKELVAFIRSGPSDVVDANAAATNQVVQEKAVINRVEYADGSIWQRKDWKFAEIRLSYQRAVGTPWGKEMCRGL